MPTAFIGLGSNLGDRLGNLAEAVEAIAHVPETHVEAVSGAYESEPAYVTDQPAFANAVIQVSTGLEAPALLGFLSDIERDMGRERDRDKGPRIIDLDLLLFGDEEWNSAELTLPHPGLLERDFVVRPLLEIAPRVTLPDGTHPRRANVTVGKVTAELGPLPDAGEARHQVPVGPDEWVVVAESTSSADALGGFDAELMLDKAALEAEGIPFAFDPYEPGADLDPFGLPMVFKLLVPADHAERALALIDEVESAPSDLPDEFGA